MNLAYWHMHDMGGGPWAFMSVGMVLMWALIVWGAVTLLRGRRDAAAPTARVILDRRLAAGELSVPDYERLREALRAPRDTAAGPPP